MCGPWIRSPVNRRWASPWYSSSACSKISTKRSKSRRQPWRSVHTSSRPWSGSRSTRAIDSSRYQGTTSAGSGVVRQSQHAQRSRPCDIPLTMRRVRAIVTGRVQGVSYRVSTVMEAHLRDLTGWVRNLPDGSVELEAQGDDAGLTALLAWCEHGPPAAREGRGGRGPRG